MEYLSFAKYGIASLLLLAGYFIVGYIVRRLIRIASEHLPVDITSILRYFLFYGLYLLFVSVTLQGVGIDISALMAAAGIAGVAIGFAAQTSFSNIISGIMLVIERSFRVGDIIIVEDIQGTIESIGPLSFVLRTIDNKLIRIPNEQLIKNKVINLTGYHLRKIGFTISFDATVDHQEIIKKLMALAHESHHRVADKSITVEYDAASNNAIGVTLYFWVKSRHVTAARSSFIESCTPLLIQYGSQSVYMAVKQ